MIADELTDRDDDFGRFVRLDGERVRRALVAYYGVEIGTEAAADALAVAWERWDHLKDLANPAGYLYRVGQSRARPHIRWAAKRHPFPTPERPAPISDAAGLIDLFNALGRLKPEQRTALLLVKSYGYTHRDVAELMGMSEPTVNNLVHRGLLRLRSILEVVQ